MPRPEGLVSEPRRRALLGEPDQPLTGLGISGVSEVNPGFAQMAVTGYQTLGVSNVPNTDGSQNRQISGDLTHRPWAVQEPLEDRLARGIAERGPGRMVSRHER